MQLVLMRVGQALLIVLAPLAVLSGVRAWVQVWSLDVQVNESPARVGSVLSASVLTSGRTYVDVTLELLQDGQTHLVGGGRVDTHWDPAMDPRPRRGQVVVRLTAEMLRQVRPGPATLRATATGRHQFTRLPPPTVREIAVTIGS
jgi:hypothetical protein